MDLSYMYLAEAQRHIDAFIDVPLSDFIFEETGEKRRINDENEKHRKGALNSLKMAFKKLIDIVKTLIDNTRNFFKEKFMSKDERESLNKLREKLKNHPEFKNAKITAYNFRDYEKLYDAAMKKLEAEANKKDPRVEACEAIIKEAWDKVTTMMASAGERAATTVAIDVALDIADKNQQCAKALDAALKTELISLEKIESTLGKDEAVKFANKAEKLANAGWIHRLKIALLSKKQKTLTAIMKKHVNKLLSFTTIVDNKTRDGENEPLVTSKSLLRGATKNAHLLKNTFKRDDADVVAKKMITNSARSKVLYKKDKKKAEKNAKELSDFLGFNDK